jgi:hypothetical protein
MMTAELARRMVQFLWSNHHTLSQQVDLEAMPPDRLDALVQQKALVWPFRIATSLARHGYFISAWSLWEFYASSLCGGLPTGVKRQKNESCVGWVQRALTANGKQFRDCAWFEGANGLRNLLAHYCGRAVGKRGQQLLTQARGVFPKIQLFKDDFVLLEHDHVAELQFRIENFIDDTA